MKIGNPLNSQKGTHWFPSAIIKDYEYIVILRNAKMSGNILLSLVGNMLDAVKLKPDKNGNHAWKLTLLILWRKCT